MHPNKEFSTTSSFLQGLRVLFVDDNADFRDLLALALQLYGVAVRTAFSVKEALEIFMGLPNKYPIAFKAGDSYIENMNAFDFQAAVALFSEDGALQPPFQRLCQVEHVCETQQTQHFWVSFLEKLCCLHQSSSVYAYTLELIFVMCDKVFAQLRLPH